MVVHVRVTLEWVVYNSANPEAQGIWKINMDGTGARRLVPGSWSTPDISPDGRHVTGATRGEVAELRRGAFNPLRGG